VIKRGIKGVGSMHKKRRNLALPWMVALRSINGLELKRVIGRCQWQFSLGRFRTHRAQSLWTPLRGQCWTLTNFPV